MKKHIQTILQDHPTLQGNCWQTAIACVLDLEPDSVPHFIQYDEDGIADWWDFTLGWLLNRGYRLERPNRHLYTNEYYLVSGPSPRGDFQHVVVYKNGKMVHDPHPSQDGVEKEQTIEVIRPTGYPPI